jgi:hypothetical protein
MLIYSLAVLVPFPEITVEDRLLGANQERWRKSSRLKKFWTIPFENVRVS